MKRFSISLPQDIYTAVEGYSSYEGISKAETVRQALIYFFTPVAIAPVKKTTKQLFIELMKSVFSK